jgi:hypothetical protein
MVTDLPPLGPGDADDLTTYSRGKTALVERVLGVARRDPDRSFAFDAPEL